MPTMNRIEADKFENSEQPYEPEKRTEFLLTQQALFPDNGDTESGVEGSSSVRASTAAAGSMNEECSYLKESAMNHIEQRSELPAGGEVDITEVLPMQSLSPVNVGQESTPQPPEDTPTAHDGIIIREKPDMSFSSILNARSQADGAADLEINQRHRHEGDKPGTDVPASKRAANPTDALSGIAEPNTTLSLDDHSPSETNSLGKSMRSENMDLDAKAGLHSSARPYTYHRPKTLSARADDEKLPSQDKPLGADSEALDKPINKEKIDMAAESNISSDLRLITKGNEFISSPFQPGDRARDNLTNSGQLHEAELQEIHQEILLGAGVKAESLPDEDKNMNLTAEFEPDLSPIRSSLYDSSTDSSSSEEGGQEGYVLLGPAEQARRLMHEDAGSDDDGGGKAGNGAASGPLRTLNEKPDEIVVKQNMKVTQEMKITELGNIYTLMEKAITIMAKASGEYEVLENGSLLCLEHRVVIGVIADTFGPVRQPYYTVRFNNADEISELDISLGTKVFYVEQFTTRLFTQALRIKGSDASNLHDEEVGDAEMEFSDDEVEAEHKKRLKQMKQSTRGGREAMKDEISRGLQPNCSHNQRSDSHILQKDDAYAINYDDNDQKDELYTPLARPSNLHAVMNQGRGDGPVEVPHTYHVSKIRGGGGRGREVSSRPHGRPRVRPRGSRADHSRRGRGGSGDRSREGQDQRLDPGDETNMHATNRTLGTSSYIDSPSAHVSVVPNFFYPPCTAANYSNPQPFPEQDYLAQNAGRYHQIHQHPAQSLSLSSQNQQPLRHNTTQTPSTYGQTHQPMHRHAGQTGQPYQPQQNNPGQTPCSYQQTLGPQRQNLPPQYPMQNYRQQNSSQCNYPTFQIQDPTHHSLPPGSYVNPAVFSRHDQFPFQQASHPELQPQQVQQPQIFPIQATSSLPSLGDPAESSTAFIAAQERLNLLHRLTQGPRPPS